MWTRKPCTAHAPVHPTHPAYEKAARNERLEATVEAVHFDDTPPYYTIRFASGERRETTREHLQKRSDGIDCAATASAAATAASTATASTATASTVASTVASTAAAAVASLGQGDGEEVQVVGECSRSEKDRRLREGADHIEASPDGPPRKRRRPATAAAAAATAAATSAAGLPRGGGGSGSGSSDGSGGCNGHRGGPSPKRIFQRAPGKPPCAHGASCYRLKPGHWREYDHPADHPQLLSPSSILL